MWLGWKWLLLGLVVLDSLWPCVSPAEQVQNQPQQSQQSHLAPIVFGLPLGSPRAHIESLFSAAGVPQRERTPEMTAYRRPVVKVENVDTTALLFYEDKLAKIALFFDITASDAQAYFRRYRELKTMLTTQYGPPKTSWEYLHERYQDHPLLALQVGRCTYANFWAAHDLDVALVLTGEQFHIRFNLQYEYRPLFQSAVQQKKEPASTPPP